MYGNTKTLTSQSNLEKEEWNRRNQTFLTSEYTQSYNHQDSMAVAQRQKYRSMEQNRKPRDKSMHLWTLVAQQVRRLPAMRETWVRSLGREDPPEKEKATHSGTLAWKIPWMEKPGRL